MKVTEAIGKRTSTRAFLDKPVSRKQVEAIFDAARWAPSGVNAQPWEVVVVTGERKNAITAAIIEAAEAGMGPHPEFSHYPDKWVEPFRTRRFQSGMALYKAQNIQRDDMEARKQSWYNNYRFFNAPVGLFFLMDRKIGHGAWIDMGIFINNVMLLAVEAGLATCPQASLTDYPDVVRKNLEISEEKILVCGMSLGYADTGNPVNQFRTSRVNINDFCTWV
jgi:nitroreductase